MNGRRAIALIIVLWVVTIMGSMALLYGRETLFGSRIQAHRLARFQAEALAASAVYRGMAELKADLMNYDAVSETWADSVESFGEVSLGERLAYQATAVDPDRETPVVRYGMTDECSKININTANKAQLLALPNMEEAFVDAIIDWRDTNLTPEPLGAEDEYYGSLAEPYLTKNANFDTIEELLLVRDITITELFGEDTNRNGVLDANENDGEDNLPLDNHDGELDRGWWPYITVYSAAPNKDADGLARLNVNTATKEEMQLQLGEYLDERRIDAIISARGEAQFGNVGQLLDVRYEEGGQRAIPQDVFKNICDLVTTSNDTQLPGLININTSPLTVLKTLYPNNEELAQRIIEYRESSDGPFDSIADLLDVEAINEDRFKNVVSMVCVRSDVFSIMATGAVENPPALCQLYAVIDRGAEVPAIRLWKMIR